MSTSIIIQLAVMLAFLMISVSSSSNSMDDIPDDYSRLARNGVRDPKLRWKKFFMFIDPEFNDNDRKIIKTASTELQKVLPCVKFWIWPKGKSPSGVKEPYIHVKKVASGCSSDVGKLSKGAQTLSLGPNCFSLTTAIHEMIHALGFHHEQSQPDRDKYVTINWQNMEKEKEHNFKKYTIKEVSTFGVPYNPKSIMHYSSKAFSINGKPTIVTKNGKIIEKPTMMQKSDITKLKRMYQC